MVDLLVRPERMPEPATDVPGRIRLMPGGAAANQAVWLARLGRAVRFAGRVGADPLGDLLLDDLRREGVEARVERDPRLPTGSVLVWIRPDGERALVTSRAANAVLTARQREEALWAGVRHLMLTGYAFAAPGSRPTAVELLAEARQRGVTVALDPASWRLLAAYPGREAFLDDAGGVDLLLPNAAEARWLAGRDDVGEAASILARDCGLVVVTLGSDGALVAERGRDPVHVPAAAPRRVVDTTGAGDLFAAAFVHAWLDTGNPVGAAAYANACAARLVAREGARPRVALPPWPTG
ncbi:MAG TPA: PfkB family carbohydrate kinase [Bacillota bacterium]